MKKIKVQRIFIARDRNYAVDLGIVPTLIIIASFIFEKIMYFKGIFTIQDPIYWIIIRVLIYSFLVILSYKKLKYYKNIFLEIDENNISIPKEVMKKRQVTILKEDIKEIFISRPKLLSIGDKSKINTMTFKLKNGNEYFLRHGSLNFEELFQELKKYNYQVFFCETSSFTQIYKNHIKFAYSTIIEKDSK